MKNELSGVIKLGQLKRIQTVLNKNWEQEYRFVDRNWNEEIEFIKKGRGQLIPVTICIDFLNENLKIEITKNNFIKTKKLIENFLKFRLLQNTSITCQNLSNSCNFQK